MVADIGPISRKILQIDVLPLVIESMAAHKKELDDRNGNKDGAKPKSQADNKGYYKVPFENPFENRNAFRGEAPVDDSAPGGTPPGGAPPGGTPPGGTPPSQIIKKTLMKKYRHESRR